MSALIKRSLFQSSSKLDIRTEAAISNDTIFVGIDEAIYSIVIIQD